MQRRVLMTDRASKMSMGTEDNAGHVLGGASVMTRQTGSLTTCADNRATACGGGEQKKKGMPTQHGGRPF